MTNLTDNFNPALLSKVKELKKEGYKTTISEKQKTITIHNPSSSYKKLVIRMNETNPFFSATSYDNYNGWKRIHTGHGGGRFTMNNTDLIDLLNMVKNKFGY